MATKSIYRIGVDGNVEVGWDWTRLGPCTVRYQWAFAGCDHIKIIQNIIHAGHKLILAVGPGITKNGYIDSCGDDEFSSFLKMYHNILDDIIHQTRSAISAIEGWAYPNLSSNADAYISPDRFHDLQLDSYELCQEHKIPFISGSIYSTLWDSGFDYLASAFADYNIHADFFSAFAYASTPSLLSDLCISINTLAKDTYDKNLIFTGVASIQGSYIPVVEEITAALVDSNVISAIKYCLKTVM